MSVRSCTTPQNRLPETPSIVPARPPPRQTAPTCRWNCAWSTDRLQRRSDPRPKAPGWWWSVRAAAARYAGCCSVQSATPCWRGRHGPWPSCTRRRPLPRSKPTPSPAETGTENAAVLVGVEAASGLPAEIAGVDHARQQLRREELRVAGLAVDVRRRVGQDVDTGQIRCRQRPHGVAEPKLARRIDVFGGGHA